MALADRLAAPAESLADSDLIVVSDLHMSLGIDSSTGRPGSRGRQTFIEIVRDSDRPSARLLWWNDRAGREEPVEPA